jgi:acyl-CoA synthetase (NDP forming)
LNTFASVFTPRGVAVCGDFQSQHKLGYRALENLLQGGYGGEVQPVSNTGEAVLGKPILSSLAGVAAEVALVALAGVPSRSIPVILKAWKPRTGQRIIVWMGEEPDPTVRQAGKKAGRCCDPVAAAVESARLLGAHFIGPQSGGIVNASLGLHLWSTRLPAIRQGGVGVIGQGVALINAALEETASHGLGVSQVIDLGLARVISCEPLLEHFAEDEKTKLVVLLVRDIMDGRAFMKAALALAMRKPVVALLPARTARQSNGCPHQGRKCRWPADRRETAAGFQELGIAARQSGIVLVNDMESLGDAVNVLVHSSHFLPISGGPLLVVSPGGLEGHLTAQLIGHGLPLPSLSKKTADRLRRRAGICNGVVVLRQSLQSSELTEVLELALRDDGVGGIILASYGAEWESLGELLSSVRAKCGKPVLAYAPHSRVADHGSPPVHGIPVFPAPERAVRGFYLLREHAGLLDILRRKGFSNPATAEPAAKPSAKNLSERCSLCVSLRWGRGNAAKAAARAPLPSVLPLPRDARPGCVCSEWATSLLNRSSIRVAARTCVRDAMAAKAFAARTVFPLSLRAILQNDAPASCGAAAGRIAPERALSLRDLSARMKKLRESLRTPQMFLTETADISFPGCIRGWRDATFGHILEVSAERFPSQARICPIGKTDAEAVLTAVLEKGNALRAPAAIAPLTEFVCKLAQMFQSSSDLAGFEIVHFGIAQKQALVLEGRMWRIDA